MRGRRISASNLSVVLSKALDSEKTPEVVREVTFPLPAAASPALADGQDESATADGASADNTVTGAEAALRMHSIAELLFYCSVGNLKAVKKLVAKQSLDLSNPKDSADYDDRTPLHLAASDGSYAVANWLLEQKAPVNHVDRFGFTPLEGAARGKHKELVHLLKSAGGLVYQAGSLVELEASALSGVVQLTHSLSTVGGAGGAVFLEPPSLGSHIARLQG